MDPSPPATIQSTPIATAILLPPKKLRWSLWANFGLFVALFTIWIIAQILVAIIGMGSWLAINPDQLSLLLQNIKNLQTSNQSSFTMDNLLSEKALNFIVPLTVASLIIGNIITIPFILLFAKLSKRGVRNYLNLQNTSLSNWFKWTGITVAFIAVEIAILSLAQPDEGQGPINILLQTVSPWLMIPAIAIGAPIIEELLFRGFLYKGIVESKLKHTGAIIITSTLFAIIHINPQASAPANLVTLFVIFILASLMGHARHQTKSLYITIWMHFINNAFATGAFYTAQYLENQEHLLK